jgi:serine/threonine protein phosphatase PrpC
MRAAPQWRVISATAKGPGHASLHRPNQDREITRPVGDDGTWVYAVADGAGSRTRSDHGALLAVEAAATAAETVFSRSGAPATLSDWQVAVKSFVKECLDAFDRRVSAEVQGLRAVSGESADQLHGSFATTLLAVVAAPPYFAYLSVGDCFLVVDRDPGGPHLVVTAPEREHAGATVFLTSRNRGSDLSYGVIMDARIRGLALCTDGLCEGMLAIQQAADGRIHQLAPPEFRVYFDHFSSPAVDGAELTMKLLSKEFAATSSDDKTIVLAVRTS